MALKFLLLKCLVIMIQTSEFVEKFEKRVQKRKHKKPISNNNLEKIDLFYKYFKDEYDDWQEILKNTHASKIAFDQSYSHLDSKKLKTEKKNEIRNEKQVQKIETELALNSEYNRDNKEALKSLLHEVDAHIEKYENFQFLEIKVNELKDIDILTTDNTIPQSNLIENFCLKLNKCENLKSASSIAQKEKTFNSSLEKKTVENKNDRSIRIPLFTSKYNTMSSRSHVKYWFIFKNIQIDGIKTHFEFIMNLKMNLNFDCLNILETESECYTISKMFLIKNLFNLIKSRMNNLKHLICDEISDFLYTGRKIIPSDNSNLSFLCPFCSERGSNFLEIENFTFEYEEILLNKLFEIAEFQFENYISFIKNYHEFLKKYQSHRILFKKEFNDFYCEFYNTFVFQIIPCSETRNSKTFSIKNELLHIHLHQFMHDHLQVKLILFPEFFSLIHLLRRPNIFVCIEDSSLFCILYFLFFSINRICKMFNENDELQTIYINQKLEKNNLTLKIVGFFIRLYFLEPILNLTSVQRSTLYRYSYLGDIIFQNELQRLENVYVNDQYLLQCYNNRFIVLSVEARYLSKCFLITLKSAEKATQFTPSFFCFSVHLQEFEKFIESLIKENHQILSNRLINGNKIAYLEYIQKYFQINPRK